MQNNLGGAESLVQGFSHLVTGPQPEWLAALRQAGLAGFTELGFPTTAHEDWRFTSLASLAKLPLEPLAETPGTDWVAELLARHTFTKLVGPRLVFVNGRFSAAFSTPGRLPAGVRVSSLAAVLASDPDLVKARLGTVAHTEGNPFTALNQAFFLDGGFIYVPAGQVVAEPVQLVHVTLAAKAGDTLQPRTLIVAEANSRLTVIESHLSVGEAAHFSNSVTELVAGENAVVEYVKYQNEAPAAFHIGMLAAQLGRASQVRLHSFALGGRLSRTNIRTQLAGEGLECILNGLYLTRGEQLADHHMIVEHARPHCASHEYFNGILDDHSRGVFHGRILVRELAQKTDAKQTNKNLLLSDDATADTKPQLEIYADDVKCTHGATIGQLNAESIFYLRSRGIGTDTARRMLIHAFAGEIIERVQCEAAREELNRVVWHRLETNHHLAVKGEWLNG
jgi:Fe-S cluster assembly protein SufD